MNKYTIIWKPTRHAMYTFKPAYIERKYWYSIWKQQPAWYYRKVAKRNACKSWECQPFIWGRLISRAWCSNVLVLYTLKLAYIERTYWYSIRKQQTTFNFWKAVGWNAWKSWECQPFIWGRLIWRAWCCIMLHRTSIWLHRVCNYTAQGQPGTAWSLQRAAMSVGPSVDHPFMVCAV